MVVDYQGDPNADTGLFVKVVPEGPRMAALAEGTAESTKIAATDVADGSGSKPGDHNTAAYRQRMERVNQKLEAIRSRMAARGPQSDRTTSGKIQYMCTRVKKKNVIRWTECYFFLFDIKSKKKIDFQKIPFSP